MGLFDFLTKTKTVERKVIPDQDDLELWIRTAEALYREELDREIDPTGLAGCLRAAWDGKDAHYLRWAIQQSDEWKQRQAKPEPAPTPIPRVARRGRVTGNGRVFVDDGGPFLAIGASLFWAPWGFLHDRARLEQNLKYLADWGVDYIRALGVVGGGSWADRESDPKHPKFDAAIEGVTDLVHTYGMRTQWTIFGGTNFTPTKTSRLDLVKRFAALAKGREAKILAFEVANEGWQNGFPGADGVKELHALVAILAKTGILVAPTCPAADTRDATVAMYQGSAASLTTLHLDRNVSGEGKLWRPVRQAWEGQFFTGAGVPDLWTSNEPIGIKSSVNADDDPLRLTCSAGLVWLTGGAGYVFHSGAGIRGGGAADRKVGRAANVWEQPKAEAILKGITNLRAMLPADLPNWQTINVSPRAHYREAYPFNLDPLLKAQDESPERLLRAFCAKKGGRYLILPIKVDGAVPFVAKFPMTVTLRHPVTGAVIRTLALATGQTLTLDKSTPAVLMDVRKA